MILRLKRSERAGEPVKVCVLETAFWRTFSPSVFALRPSEQVLLLSSALVSTVSKTEMSTVLLPRSKTGIVAKESFLPRLFCRCAGLHRLTTSRIPVAWNIQRSA